VDLLIRYGAKVKSGPQVFASEFTPLLDACRAAHQLDKIDPSLRVCRSLLSAGAEVNGFGPHKETVLMLAPSLELTKLFLVHGANIDAINDEGMSSTGVSACFGQVGSLKVLLQAGGDPNEAVYGALLGLAYGTTPGSDQGGMSALDLALWAGASPSQFLFILVSKIPSSVIQKLLWYGASTTNVDLDGVLPIQVVFSRGASSAVLSLLAPHDGYELTDPKTNKITVITKTDPGPPQFTAYELEFDFCAHCRRESTTEADVDICGGCMLVAYCGKDCQKAHREKHKRICEAKQVADSRRAQFTESE
jgi:hypothetical protein